LRGAYCLSYALTPRLLNNSYSTHVALPSERELHGYTPEAPFAATIQAARFLTSHDALKHVLHVELGECARATHTRMTRAGSAAPRGRSAVPPGRLAGQRPRGPPVRTALMARTLQGFYCPNEPDVVDAVLERLQLSHVADKPLTLKRVVRDIISCT
jgi:hypothetical protein